MAGRRRTVTSVARDEGATTDCTPPPSVPVTGGPTAGTDTIVVDSPSRPTS